MKFKNHFSTGRAHSETSSDAPEGVKPIESDMPHQRDIGTWRTIDQSLRARRLRRQEMLERVEASSTFRITVAHPFDRTDPLPIVRSGPLREDHGDIMRLKISRERSDPIELPADGCARSIDEIVRETTAHDVEAWVEGKLLLQYVARCASCMRS